jgi:enoyl-CoA hydratase
MKIKQQESFMTYENILLSHQDHVGIITLNRPQALNALCEALVSELGHALDTLEADDSIHAIILTGSEKAFAAGADIKEMKDKTYMSAYREDFITQGWQRITYCRKPIIAAVSGYALGGGCEMAMMCDFIIASETAKFGQPEITIGTIPGSGGTQRLARSIGKAKAMDLCLTGRMMGAEEAERCGLVSRIVPQENLMDEALKAANAIAGFSLPVAMMTKECVNRAFETSLEEGLKFERRVFHSTFALEDRKEGMTAFLEKRKPIFKNK